MYRRKPVVWFVDDLPSNLATFRRNHDRDFAIATFARTDEVVARLRGGERPDALLCDMFYFDTVGEAQGAEETLARLARELQERAGEGGVDNRRHAGGIALMRDVSAQFDGAPPFPVYAYSSKAPYLFGQAEWEAVYRFGGRVLLKGRAPSDVERRVILADIASSQNARAGSGAFDGALSARLAVAVAAILAALVTIAVGRLVRGAW